MFSKSFIAPIILLALTSSVNAHAAVSPALAVNGAPVRNDVQRPSSAEPCGNVNIAQNLDSSTPVQALANGTFSPSITDFNAGADGSRSIKTVQVDASGTGKNFVPATMVVNGDANPTSVGTQQLSVQLPSGTKCTGGASKNLCLASFTTTAGFGNCVVVSQGAGAASSPASQASPLPSGAAKGVRRSASKRTADDAQASSPKKDNKKGKDDKKKGDKKDDKMTADSGKAAKGENRLADNAQSSPAKKDDKKGKDKKKKGDKKDDKKTADLSKAAKGENRLADNIAADDAQSSPAKKDKAGKKKGGKGKKANKKKGGKGKKADKAKGSSGPAATQKRSWSSRSLMMKRIDW